MNIKRYIVAGAAAATLAGGAFAFAANLDVTSSTLAAGDTSIDGDCDTVEVDFAPAYDSATHTYLINDVELDGDDGCNGETYEVKIDRVDALSDITLDGTFGANGNAVETFASGDELDAADVLHVTAIATGTDLD